MRLHRIALEASHLHREFGRKRFVAVDDVSLRILPGQIVALLGPNGAGKTTSIKMCATTLSPTSGEVIVDGVDAVAQPAAARSRLGLVLGGDGGFYGRASARDNLLFFADVAGVPGGERHAAVARSLAAVGLTSRADTKVREYSRGMKQRLHLARGLLRAPALMLLDEPTNGLDPEYALDMRATVRDVAAAGAGVLLTTHMLAEAEALADYVVVIDNGRCLVEGSIRDIGGASGLSVVSTLSFQEGSALPQEIATRWASTAVSLVQTPLYGRTHVRLEWRHHADERAFRDWLNGQSGTDDANVVSRPPTLEESYLALTTSHRSEGG